MKKKQLQINLTIEDNRVIAMDYTEDTFHRVSYLEEYEEEKLRKIEVLQILHSIIDEYMK